MTTVGSFIGIAAALIVTRAFSKLLFEVSPLDTLSFTAAVVAFAMISICACLFPAWRASHVDPMVALRYE